MESSSSCILDGLDGRCRCLPDPRGGNNDDQLQHGYETMLEHLKQLGGVLQDYSPPSCDYLPELITPVKDWRSTVRTAIADREVQKLRVASQLEGNRRCKS